MNTIGRRLRFTDFGESHGLGVGGVVDGLPSGIAVDEKRIYTDLKRRAGYIDVVSGEYSSDPCPFVSRRSLVEEDKIYWLSGLSQMRTTGTPIAYFIKNKQADSDHYLRHIHSFRVGHGDWTYQEKYNVYDKLGGGRYSARETATRVVAGQLAKPILDKYKIAVRSHITQIGEETDERNFHSILLSYLSNNDSIGAIVECRISNLPIGLGEPIFDKLQSCLSYAMLSINACKGFDYGTGFKDIGLSGHQMYDNNSVPFTGAGGIEAGLSNGLDVCFRCVFKPTSSIIADPGGRHDTCLAIRAMPVVENMASLVIADFLLTDNRFSNEFKLSE